MKNRPEMRVTSCPELRATADGKISGYAAVFDSPSSDLGGFTETIRRGAFSRVLRERQDICCLFNHSANYLLGRTKSGTLELEEDQAGLHFECELPDTSFARDLRESIARGDVSGCSFSFAVAKDEWASDNRRELIELKSLMDVGPVCFPAYDSTSVSARSLGSGLEKGWRFGYYARAGAGGLDAEEIELLQLRLKLAMRL
jgi:hypothetical protein